MENLRLIGIKELDHSEVVDVNGGFIHWGAYQGDIVQFGIGFFSAVGAAFNEGYNDVSNPK